MKSKTLKYMHDLLHTLLKKGFVLAIVLFTSFYSLSAPANDDCSGATTVTSGTTCTTTPGELAGATASISGGKNDVWFSFVAVTTTHYFNVSGSGTFNPVIDIYASCSSITTTLKNINTGTGVTENGFITGLTVGSTYYYRVYHNSTTAPSVTNFTTCVTNGVVNDEISKAITLTPGAISTCTPTNGTIENATGIISTSYEDVWYSFTASKTTHYFNVSASGNFYPDIAVYSSTSPTSSNNLTYTSTSSSASSTTETGYVTGLTIGTTYYYRIYHNNTTNPTPFTFTTCVTEGLVNDEISGAINITPGNTCSTTNGTIEKATGVISSSYEDVWYKFTATNTSHFFNVTTTVGNFNPEIAFYPSTVTTPSSSNDLNYTSTSSTSNSEIGYLTGLTVGATYFYRIYHNSSTNPTSFTFTTCITKPVSNDECSGAIELIPGGNCENGDLTIGTPSTPLVSCGAGTDIDVWYKFTAVNASHFINITPSSGFDPILQVNKGTCSSLTSVICESASTAKGIATSTALTGLSIGQIYYYRITNNNTTSPTYTFSSCIANTIENDDCEGALKLKVNDACEFNTQTNLNSTKTVLSTDASTNTDCNDVTYNDVWYKIVVPTNGQIYVFTEKIDNTFAGGGMALLRGTCSSMTTVKCIASTTKMPSLNVTTGLTPGETLYLRLWGTTSSDIGNFKLCVSSPPVCTSNPAANDVCSNATLICNLNGYCGSTLKCNPPSITTNCYVADEPNNLMSVINATAGNSSVSMENNSWLSFTASATSASFTVYVSGCSGNGIQLGVFDATNCNNFSLRSTFFNGYDEPFVVTANNLVPGNKYLIMIDGSSGDVCQYKIAAAYGFSTSTAGPDQTVCSGSTVTLQASGPSGATFTWKQGATTIGTGASLVLNPSPIATTTYTVEITGGTLCSPFTDEVIINVENCCPTLTLPSDNQRICKDGTPSKLSVKTTETSANGVKFVYFTSQQTGTAMYTGGTLLGNATIVGGMAYYTPTSLGTSGSLPNVAGDYYVYALLATTSGPTCKPFQEIKVTVYEPPVVTVNNPTICVGETATITATVLPAGSYNYSWTVPSGFTNPGNVASFTTTTPGSYTVSVTNKSLICNTDFDDVNLSILNNIKLENESSVPCWKTSATDDMIEFWGNGFNSVPSYSGNQFVELNATQASTLYQDFTMTPNSTVEISFAHRGRDGVDVMKVEIGPVGGPYENLGTFSDGNTAWGYYSINYTFPNSGSTNYRIQFTAVSSTGGAASFGNLLDAISIKNFACPILPATGTLTTGSPILNITDPAPVCPGTTVDLTANSITATSTTGLTFTYWMNSACTTPIPAANGTSSAITTAGTYYIKGSTSATCSTSKSVEVKFKTKPTVTVPSNIEVCNGNAIAATSFSSSPTGATFAWTNNNTNIGLAAASGSGNISTFNGENTGTSQISATISVTPTLDGCPGTAGTYTIKVNPGASIQTKTDEICTGEAFVISSIPTDIIPTSNMNYTWIAANQTGITGNSPNNTGVSSFAGITQTLNNTTNAPITYKYVVTANYGISPNICSSNFDVNIKVNPKPVIKVKSSTNCSNVSFTVPSDATDLIPISDMKYKWTVANVTGITGNADNQTGVTNYSDITQQLTNTTLSPLSIKYVVTATYGTSPEVCSSNFDVNVTVNPGASIQTKTDEICSGEAFSISSITGDIIPASNMNYTWTVANESGITGNSPNNTGVTTLAGITQTLNNTTNAPVTIKYVVTANYGISPNICSSNFDVNVKVNPKPVIQTKTDEICSGEAFAITSIATDKIPTSNMNYTWTVANEPGITGNSPNNTGVNSFAGITQTLNNTTTAPVTIKYVLTATFGISPEVCASNFDVNIKVNPTPVILAKSDEICTGEAFAITSIATDKIPASTINYTWTVANEPGITGNSPNNTGVSTLAGITQTLNNTSAAPVTIKYVVTATYGTSPEVCTSNFDVNVKVNPKPVIQTKSDEICTGEAFAITSATGDIVPTSTMNYTWTVANEPGITGNSPNNTGVSTLAGITQTLNNTTAAPVTIKYVVTASYGTLPEVCTSNFDVNIKVNPKPVIQTKTDEICSGEVFAITSIATDKIPTSNMNYTWTVANEPGITGNSPNNTGVNSFAGITQTLNNTSTAPVTIKYVLTATYGISPEVCASNFDVNIKVNPKPVIQAKSDEICTGEAFAITSIATDKIPTSSMNYTWTVANEPSITGNSPNSTGVTSLAGITQTLNNTSAAPVTIKYVVTATYGTSPEVCTSNFDVNIKVNPKPAIQTKSDEICSGEAFVITSIPADVIPTSNMKYTWTVANTSGISGNSVNNTGVTSLSSITQTLNNTTVTPATINYVVTATYGTSPEVCSSNFDINVTVNPTPTITGVSTVCISSTSSLTGSVTAATSNAWTSATPSVVSINSSTGLITGISKGTSVITYTDAKNCKNTLQINVPDPVISGVLNVCEGKTTQLTSSGINALTNPWVSNPTSIATIDNSGIVTGILAGNSVITYTDKDGCKKTANIKVNPTPTINFTSDIDKGCIPLTVVFKNNSIPTSDSVKWNFGDGTIISLKQNLGEIKHTFTSGGCFDISLQSSAFGCSNNLTNVKMICPLPSAVASFSVDKTIATTLDPTIMFTNNSTNASIFDWDFGDLKSSILENVSHEFEAVKGQYVVTLIANNDGGCSDTTSQLIKIEEELVFYIPNAFTPDEDNLNLQFIPVFNSGYDPYDFTMYIFNRWGEIVFESHDASKGWSGLYGIDGQKCQDGLYIWKIKFKETKTNKEKVATGNVMLIR